MKHISGGKIHGKHTTLTDEAYKLVKAIMSDPLVKKISLGLVKQGLASTRNRHLDVAPQNGVIMVSLRSSCSINQFVVYTDDPKKLEKLLYQKYNDLFG